MKKTKYIITEKNDLEDARRISAEEKTLRSINAKDNRNAKNGSTSRNYK